MTTTANNNKDSRKGKEEKMSLHDYIIITGLIIGGLAWVAFMAWIIEKINKK